MAHIAQGVLWSLQKLLPRTRACPPREVRLWSDVNSGASSPTHRKKSTPLRPCVVSKIIWDTWHRCSGSSVIGIPYQKRDLRYQSWQNCFWHCKDIKGDPTYPQVQRAPLSPTLKQLEVTKGQHLGTVNNLVAFLECNHDQGYLVKKIMGKQHFICCIIS